MKVIGITGPTGAGKTTALNALVALGGRIIDADAVYHDLTRTCRPMREELEARFGPGGACDGSIVTNARQADAVRRAAEALGRARAGLAAGLTPDAVLIDVEEALEAMGELTGRTVREDITNRIFERFCVGK